MSQDFWISLFNIKTKLLIQISNLKCEGRKMERRPGSAIPQPNLDPPILLKFWIVLVTPGVMGWLYSWSPLEASNLVDFPQDQDIYCLNIYPWFGLYGQSKRTIRLGLCGHGDFMSRPLQLILEPPPPPKYLNFEYKPSHLLLPLFYHICYF